MSINLETCQTTVSCQSARDDIAPYSIVTIVCPIIKWPYISHTHTIIPRIYIQLVRYISEIHGEVVEPSQVQMQMQKPGKNAFNSNWWTESTHTFQCSFQFIFSYGILHLIHLSLFYPIEFYPSSYISVLAVLFWESLLLFLDTNYIKPIYICLLIALQIKLLQLRSVPA